MRKMIPVLFALGGFLLVAGLIAALWAPGMVKKTPLDVSTTTKLSGQAEKLNTATGELEANPVNATNVTKTDSKISDDKVVAWTNSSCLVIDRDDPPACVDGQDDRLISATTDVFASDRETALAVNDGKYLPADADEHKGIMNKWPFDAEKKTYPYWDGTAGMAVDAKYVRTVSIRGIDTYLYRVEIKDAPIEIGEGITGTYDDVKEMYVEPRTGSILNQTDDQQRFLDDGDKVLDLQLAFTDAQTKANADDAKENISSLNLITRTIPLVGLIGGVICLAAACVLLLLSRGRSSHSTQTSRSTPTVSLHKA